MPDSRNIWCLGTKDGWAVRPEGTNKPIRLFRVSDDAWKFAKDKAIETGGQAFRQGLSGRIIDQF